MCTLYLASVRYGSTATAAKTFSSLMSIKAALNEKHSSDYWMAILGKFRSKEASEMLDTLEYFLRPTSPLHCGETLECEGDSSEEGTSDSQAEEDTTADLPSSFEEEHRLSNSQESDECATQSLMDEE